MLVTSGCWCLYADDNFLMLVTEDRSLLNPRTGLDQDRCEPGLQSKKTSDQDQFKPDKPVPVFFLRNLRISDLNGLESN